MVLMISPATRWAHSILEGTKAMSATGSEAVGRHSSPVWLRHQQQQQHPPELVQNAGPGAGESVCSLTLLPGGPSCPSQLEKRP